MKSSSVVSYAALVVAVAALGLNCICKKDTAKVVYLDNQKIIAQADLFRQLDGEEAKHVNAMIARRNEDEKMLQIELAQLRQKIQDSPQGEKAFQKEIAEFDQKVTFYNIKYRNQQALIARAKAMARQQVEPYIQEALNELAAKGYDLILPKINLNYGNPVLEKTDDYIKILNDKNVVVSFPDPASLIPQQAPEQQNGQPVEKKEPTKKESAKKAAAQQAPVAQPASEAQQKDEAGAQ